MLDAVRIGPTSWDDAAGQRLAAPQQAFADVAVVLAARDASTDADDWLISERVLDRFDRAVNPIRRSGHGGV